jgi:hypothetical protein
MKRKLQPRPRLNPFFHVIRETGLTPNSPHSSQKIARSQGKYERSCPGGSGSILTSTLIGVLRLWQLTYNIIGEAERQSADTEGPQTSRSSEKRWVHRNASWFICSQFIGRTSSVFAKFNQSSCVYGNRGHPDRNAITRVARSAELIQAVGGGHLECPTKRPPADSICLRPSWTHMIRLYSTCTHLESLLPFNSNTIRGNPYRE